MSEIFEYHKKYRVDNRDAIYANHKAWRDENLARLNVKMDCPCGSKFAVWHRSRHYKSIKHTKYKMKRRNEIYEDMTIKLKEAEDQLNSSQLKIT